MSDRAERGGPAPVTAPPPVSVGETITIPEADYMYGAGPLRIRVTHVSQAANLRQLEWIDLLGVEIVNGRDGQHRRVLVRVAALRSLPRPNPETA